MTIMSTNWVIRVGSVTTGRAKWPLWPHLVGGHLMWTVTSMLLLTSMIAVFFLRITFCSALQGAFMSSLRYFFRIKIPMVSIRCAPIMVQKLINKLYILRAIDSKRMQQMGHKVGSDRRHVYVPLSTTHIMFCHTYIRMTLRRVIQIVSFMISCIFYCRVLQQWAYNRDNECWFSMSDILPSEDIHLICSCYFHNTTKVSWVVQVYL